MAVIKIKNKCQQGCRGNGNLVHFWWECKLMQPLWKLIWGLSKKIELLYDSAIPLMGIYEKEFKSAYDRNTCTLMFIATLCTLPKL
jgi:hypothetical protein